MTGWLVFPAEPVGPARRLAAGAALALLPVACALLYLFDPADPGLYPLCPFRALTVLYCPGCGSLRAMHKLLRGRPGAALGLNPLALLLLPVLGHAAASGLLAALRGRALPRVLVPAPWIWGLFGGILAFWVLRNVPVAPFTRLAP